MKTESCLLTLAAVVAAALPLTAEFADGRLEIPTYTPGGYEKTPVFYTGRVYQGAQGRMYPYPAQDVLHDKKHAETYRYLTLENPWLQMGVLPEHGGHLLNLTDKATGFETFYRQHVIKPALIGMLGAWISGGVEWNFPHHHRPTSSMPVDWTHARRPDGTDTIWLGETELTAGLKWTIGLTLLKDRAVLRAENIFMNRSPRIESMLYWANVAVHCNEDYQVLFPPSCHLGFDHHKASWTSFPIGSVGTSGEPGMKARHDDDLSYWRNHVHHFRSIFAWDPDNAWLAGYDHGRDAGTVHVSNRHITFGKKFFLWGNFPGAFAWDEVLTDTDGPYLELMVGCWSDNQPDYSWIGPYETRRVSQFWYPVKGIGGVKHATIDGAVNVERLAADKLRVGFHSTRELKGCRVVVTENGRTVFEEKDIAIGPNRAWCRTVPVAGVAKDQAFEGRLLDAEGKTVLAYRPVPDDPHDPLPERVANPQFPEKITSAETAYLTGLRLDQFKNGLIDPLPYYRRALEIDPGYSAANLMLGYHAMTELRYADAEALFKAAADRTNRNYTRAKDVEPEYMQALACRAQGKLKEAEDLFWRVTWRATHKREAYVELARLACLRGDWTEALERIDDALDLGRREAKLHVIRAFVLRRLGDKAASAREIDEAFACDPLENWGAAERGFQRGLAAEEIVAEVLKNRGLKAHQLIETLCDYAGLGAWEEVVALAGAAESLAAREQPVAAGSDDPLPVASAVAACGSLGTPMIPCIRGWALGKLGRDAEAKLAFERTAALPGERCFPSRPEEYEALVAADAAAPAANISYYLGEILTFRDRKDAAEKAWRKAVEQDPGHALAWRGLGFILSHPGTYFVNTGVPTGVANEEAFACYAKSLAADPSNAHVLLEYDELAELMKVPAERRLRELEARRDVAGKYDPVLIRIADLMIAQGRFDDALELLRSRKFYVWEGGKDLIIYFTDAALGSARKALADGDLEKAVARCELAMTYPVNLQAAQGADAGVAPEACVLIAEVRRAQRDAAGERKALERALAGWSRPGRMNAFRIEALKALAKLDGKAVDPDAVKAQAEQLDREIERLEKPLPRELHASRKFFSGGTPEEAEAANRREAAQLRALKAKALEGTGF